MPRPSLLVIKPSSLGDIIQSLIVLQTLKDQRPEIEVHFVVRDRFADLPAAAECVDRVIPFRRRDGFPAFLRLLKEIRHERYDMVWDMQGLLRTGLMAYFSRSPRKLGRSDSREGSGFLIREKAPLPADGSMHAVDILLQYLRSYGLEPKPGRPARLQAPPLASIDARLAGLRPILMIPHSRGKEKEWPGFSALTERLLADGVKQPIVWDSHLAIDAGSLEEHPNFINTSGKTSIAQMIALTQSSSLVVANDCGPMHLASASQIPTLAIFGPTDPARFGAYPLNSPSNANLKAPGGDWTKLPLDDVVNAVYRLLQVSRA